MHLGSTTRSRLYIAVLFYCSAVGCTPFDGGGSTWLDLIAGFGSFANVIRDCGGKILRQDDFVFKDAGISVHHNVGLVSFMGKVGTFHSTPGRTIVNQDSSAAQDQPYSTNYFGAGTGYQSQYFGVEVGLIYFSSLHSHYLLNDNARFQPMGRIRIGIEDKWFFSTSLLYDNTLLSQGGIWDFGFGGRLSESRSTIWAGLGGGRYDQVQFIARTMIVPKDWNVGFLLSGNTSASTNPFEFGISLGVRLYLPSETASTSFH